MQLLLGENEQVVHSWDYAVQKKLIGFKRRYSLTLTNKRIVQTETLKRGIFRKDFLLDDITGVDVNTNTVIRALFIFFALICVVAAIITFAVVGGNIFGIIIGIILLAIAVLFFIKALNHSSLTISIYGVGGSTQVAGVTSGWYKLSAKTIKLKVNKQNCQEIAENLSKLILIDLKNTK